MKKEERKLLHKPLWIDHLENGIAQAIPFHPNLLSAAKLFIVGPLLILTMKQVGILPVKPILVLLIFTLFALLDYLDGLVARYKDLATNFGRVFDRITDYPILLILSFFCIDLIPISLLAIKIGLDLLLMILYIRGFGSTENRIRTAMSLTILLTLLFVSQGWGPKFISPKFVIYLLLTNIFFSTVVALYNLHILQKRFIADALSMANLLCGVFSMIFAYRNRIDISLLFLMLGAAFDGFDGAAARKFGGTRFGVYSDDIADGVNYGIAPGVALYFIIGGAEGLITGIFYSFFTTSRLVFFTLNKNYGDPEYFCGVPSTVGALIALCSIILFRNNPVLLGLMVGVACAQMVSFDSQYRHFGRLLATNRRVIYGIPILIIILIAGYLSWGINSSVTIILAIMLVYGYLPTIMSFVRIIKKRTAPESK